MPIDHERISKFIAEDDFRQVLAQVVRGIGLEITWVKSTGNSRLWGLYLKPNQPLRDLLSVKRELLVWVADFEEYQPRSVSQALDIVTAERPRLSEQFVIIITPDPDTYDLVKNTSAQLSPMCIGFAKREIIQFSEANAEDFLRVLQSRLYVRDLYWVSTPIQSPRHFYGRQTLLTDVASSLINSQTHIGLFGLRKMGKTSFLYRLLEVLQQRYRCYLCYLDMELIDAVSPSAEYFLWSLGSAILDSLGRLKVDGLQLFGRYPSYFAVENTDAIPGLFVRDMQVILSKTNQAIVIALDEIELMAPPTVIKGSKWGDDSFVRIWRILRGLAQQYPGRLSFFITGTNPRIIETNRIGVVDNPIYSYFRKEYLRPLTKLESKQLLSEIGSLVGLSWTEEALDLVHRRVGGHPLLLRAYGSVIHNAKLPRVTQANVTVDDITAHAKDFMTRASSHLSQMLDVISDYYKDEFMLLEMLATGRIGEFREFAITFPNEIAHLKGYGLIEFTDARCEIVVEPLQTWMQRRQRSEIISTEALGRKGDPLIGKRIDNYIIEASVGHRGGFARVYKARHEKSGDIVAIKVLKNGLLSALQREVDVLSEFEHPNLVKMINSGKTPDGIVYLVMEYLEGNTLRSHCERTSRLAPDQLRSVALSLLSALAHLHPNSERVSQLRVKQELSAHEYAEFERARHGKIHRDIKPENVILTPGRGPVLIDFNISVTASDPMLTQSHTPGYLPPDMRPGQWTPDVDLYQLGLTLIQVATGIEYKYDESGNSNLSDIRDQVKNELHSEISNVLLKLCSPRQHQRFASAREALRRLR